MILKVARLGFPVLRSPARSVAAERISTAEFQKLLDDMVETMHEYRGVGLAAPQVHVPLQVACFEVEHHPRDPEMAPIALTFLINPIVTILDRTTSDEYEGCLSIPDLRGRVPRFNSVSVRALDRAARPIEIVASGFHARVIQHETDHLKGDVYLDRMRDMRSLSFVSEWQRFAAPPPEDR